jgi:hypothetical protein
MFDSKILEDGDGDPPIWRVSGGLSIGDADLRQPDPNL